MESIIKLRSKFNKVEKDYKKLKLAILSDSTSQFFVQGLKAYGIKIVKYKNIRIKILIKLNYKFLTSILHFTNFSQTLFF